MGCEKALADEGKSDLQTIKTATITTSVNGYTSGGAYANVEKSYYNTGETLNLKWKGAAVGSDFVIPTSVKYSASSTEITSDKLVHHKSSSVKEYCLQKIHGTRVYNDDL